MRATARWYFDLIREGKDIAAIRDMLVFGPSVAGGEEQGVESLPDTAEICGCNGVSKGRILTAIAELKLTTVDEVRARTKASASCGSCTCNVEKLLSFALGSEYDPTPKVKAMCKCTAFGHDAVRAAIAGRGLKSIPAVMRALDWSTPDGCASCRPALNYYLLCAWPGEYVDDSRSRFVNERMHANIQKDGTYSVIPRMWGGTTTAAELRAIADVVDKYQIPTVKITGGQRIDMLGVRKEQLPERVARSECRRHGLRPRLRQGAAHGENLRWLGMVPLWHTGFHQHGRGAGEDDLGLLDPAQDQDGGLRLPA